MKHPASARLTSIPVRGAVGNALAGAIAALYWLLALMKLSAIDAILSDPLAGLIVAALLSEAAIGTMILLRADSLLPWACGLALSLAFVLFAVFGPPIRSCFCLGLVATVGPKWRVVAGCALGLLTALGAASLRPASLRRPQ